MDEQQVLAELEDLLLAIRRARGPDERPAGLGEQPRAFDPPAARGARLSLRPQRNPSVMSSDSTSTPRSRGRTSAGDACRGPAAPAPEHAAAGVPARPRPWYACSSCRRRCSQWPSRPRGFSNRHQAPRSRLLPPRLRQRRSLTHRRSSRARRSNPLIRIRCASTYDAAACMAAGVGRRPDRDRTRGCRRRTAPLRRRPVDRRARRRCRCGHGAGRWRRSGAARTGRAGRDADVHGAAALTAAHRVWKTTIHGPIAPRK